MTWYGKKFKRVSCENIDELIEAARISPDRAQLLKSPDAAFTYTREGDSFTFTLDSSGRTIASTFQLGSEHEMERRDGSKVKVIHHLENENVLSQIITEPINGFKTSFRREFHGNKCVLTIKSSANDITGKIFYEAVE